jgi:16S rRNA (guanine(966)-N(2))-methyltransferase RsmD
MVREAFFSILGNAIPGRVFVDIFAGTGVVGMEALSRGAKMAYFVERDAQLAQAIDKHLKKFDLLPKSRLFRTDAYRWVSAWKASAEPVNVFLSPPFPDLHEQPEALLKMLKTLQQKVAVDSLIVLQGERDSPVEEMAELRDWELRSYGRNLLYIWQKESSVEVEPEATGEHS